MTRYRPTQSLDPIRRHLAALLLLGLYVAGCQRHVEREVVVYTALDREYSEPIFAEFTRQTGIRVRSKFDTEANKTVGLVELIRTERNRPRCDLFWNNEILNTLRLEREGLLQPATPTNAQLYPAEFKSSDAHWYGFAARARVLLINTERMGDAPRPTSLRDLLDPRWQGEVGIAKPLFGTTATHAACLFSIWGTTEASTFFRQLKQQVQVLPGNRQVAQAVGAGQLQFGLTDTDDALIEIDRGMPVEIIYPDQQAGGIGTLFIPNTLGIVQGCQHAELARQLCDYLLSPEVEARLSAASGQIPLNSRHQSPLRVESPRTVRAMEVDFGNAAAGWEATAQILRQIGF
ncbi:MAG: extracellular solute-binding protein [Planctomycetales bacterium]|nr:extracellular solute-binding protein [Planctomycetales bacterium]